VITQLLSVITQLLSAITHPTTLALLWRVLRAISASATLSHPPRTCESAPSATEEHQMKTHHGSTVADPTCPLLSSLGLTGMHRTRSQSYVSDFMKRFPPAKFCNDGVKMLGRMGGHAPLSKADRDSKNVVAMFRDPRRRDYSGKPCLSAQNAGRSVPRLLACGLHLAMAAYLVPTLVALACLAWCPAPNCASFIFALLPSNRWHWFALPCVLHSMALAVCVLLGTPVLGQALHSNGIKGVNADGMHVTNNSIMFHVKSIALR